ncbi:MAG: ATP-binding protein [Gammaproteobacteria bacterium]
MTRQSIRSRVVALAIAPAAAIALLLGAYFINTRIDDLEQALTERGQAIANQLAPAGEYGVFSGNRAFLRSLADAVLHEPDVSSVIFTDPDGRVLIRVSRETEQSVSGVGHDLAFRAAIHQTELPVNDFDVNSDVGAADSHSAQGPVIGWVNVNLSHAATTRRQHQILRNSLLITLIGLICSAFVALRIGRGVTIPIMRLTRTVERLGRGELNTRVERGSTGELGTLEHGINNMAAALQTAHGELQEQVDRATAELRETLEAVEIQNVELDIARKRALQASKVKSEFLANMSHEIRTPMNGILGFVDLLSRTATTVEQQDYVSTIRKSATNLLAIVNDILDFSKIESGKLLIDLVPFDLRETVEDALALLAPAAHEKNLELVSLIYSDVPTHLSGDPIRIRQIVINLTGNAIKFTNQGSVVVRVMVEEDDDEGVLLKISVTDTGIGLSEEEQTRLFVAFSQADTSATRRFGGTGLGLVISKKLLEQMNGRIGLESEAGKGSTFWFTLRCKKQGTVAGQPTISALAGFRVLLHDPHPLARLSVRHSLSAWEMDVTETVSRKQLFEELANSRNNTGTHQIAIISLSTDEADASTLTDFFTELFQIRRLPVLALLNSVDHDRMVRVCDAGADTCLCKPPRQETLRRTLCELLDVAVEPASATPAIERSPIRPPDFTGLRVLLADDNNINRKLIGMQLEQLGIQVTQAVNGREAVQCADSTPFDIILMDIHMPEMSGEEASKAIHSNRNANRGTPIIALTANAQPGERERLLASDLDDCLIKPIPEPVLWHALTLWSGRGDAESGTEIDEQRNLTLDMKQSAQLAGGNRQLADELFRMLLDELPQRRREVAHAATNLDLDGLREHAHKLHGSAAYCGVPQLKAAAARLEMVSTHHDRGAVPAAVENLLKAVDDLLAERATARAGRISSGSTERT